MRDDQRKRVLMFRTNVNEMNVEPVDLGDEMRQGLQLRLALAPIVVIAPILREFPHRRELNALCCIRDRFPLRPFCGVDAFAQVGDLRLRKTHREGTDRAGFGPRHSQSPGLGGLAEPKVQCVEITAIMRAAISTALILKSARLNRACSIEPSRISISATAEIDRRISKDEDGLAPPCKRFDEDGLRLILRDGSCEPSSG